ncbi:hypothetical protein [Vibrio sp. SCSIO 43137]|uniref:hypothetical protein n=1 Tax=Vibrio sp. SCSIO 43137 TaxID=3021011 RepID=UPI002307F722|nr:hypothetical protein [Vibrio sp. SCSIO 43137]WCE31121.1 hypothetical protein PK654_07605 [Vibrio sp. SCSIO 43137]
MSRLEMDKKIEAELILMLTEGYDSAPITHKLLFERLKAKNVISSKGTLTTRTPIIELYKEKQIATVKGAFGESLAKGKNQTRAELIRRNAILTQEAKEAKEQLIINTTVLLSIVKNIKTQSIACNIERLLSPHLIRELNNNKL